MKKLSRSITVITSSLFISSLILLSASAPFADSGYSKPVNQMNLFSIQAGQKVREQADSSLKPESILPTLPKSDSSLSKKYLDNLLAAELAFSRGDLKVALENYSWVAKETQDPKISRRATEIALLYGLLAPARDAALVWAKNDPTNLEAKLTAAAILIQANELKSALPFLKQIEQLKPQDASDQFLILYKQLEDPTTRGHIVQLLEQLNSQNAYIALSEIYLFQSEAAKALINSEKAIQLVPNQTQAIILHTQSLVANNQLENAKSFLNTQIKKQANNIELKFFYIQFYEAQGDLNKAHDELNLLAKMEGLNASELFILARLSMEGKWFTQAEDLLKKLEKIPEQSDLARYFLGRLSEVQSHPTQAIQWYQKVEASPFYGIAHIRISLIYNDLKNPTAGLQILESMEIGPEDERAVMLAKIEILASMQDYNKALVLVDGLLKETPDDAELQNVRAALVKKIAEGAPSKGKAPSLVRQR